MLSPESRNLVINQSDCSFTESAWHIIVGGQGLYEKLSSVELFNWKTGEQCLLQELPHGIAAHSGTVMDGVPVICGGFTTDTDDRCFKLNKTSHYWVQVSNFFTKISKSGQISMAFGYWLSR